MDHGENSRLTFSGEWKSVVKIYIAKNPTEAHILCELLKTQNVSCEVRGEGIFSLQGELPISPETNAYIWLLAPSKHTLALSIIEEYEAQRNSNAPSWYCHLCGEENESQFGLCWNCGALPESH